jgi:hypothetical protein
VQGLSGFGNRLVVAAAELARFIAYPLLVAAILATSA